MSQVVERQASRQEDEAVAPTRAAGFSSTVDRTTWWVMGLVLVGQGVVALDVQVPVLRPLIALLVLVGVPLLVLVRRVSWRGTPLADAIVLSVGASVLCLILGALAMNTVLPVVGVDRPLALAPITAVSTVVDVGLLLWRPAVPLAAPRLAIRSAQRVLEARLEPSVAIALGSVLLAVVGAVRLNNGAGSAVAVAGHVLAGLALVLLMPRRSASLLVSATTVALASTSLLLSTSLRGWVITGHDVQREYIAYLLTQGGDRWQMESYQSAYNACLSVNILPTVLSNSTALSGLLVFKVLLQVLFALVPVVVLLLARRLLSARMAVLATVFFVAFPTFYNDMPYLVRQEVAFLFVALALLAAVQESWSVRRRRIVVVGLAMGVVLSHYSTTYMLLLALGVGSCGALATKVLTKRRSGRSGQRVHSPMVLLHPLVIIAIVAGAWAWTGPATQTGGHLEETVVSTWRTLLGEESGPGSSDLAYGIFGGAQATPEERLDLYVEDTMRQRAEDPADLLLDEVRPDELRPEVLEPTLQPLTGPGRALSERGVDVQGVNSLLRLAAAALLQLFLLVGLGGLLLRTRLVRRCGPETLWLALGSLAALGLGVVIPSLSAAYGVLRAFQQGLLVLAPLVAVGAVLCFSWVRQWAAPAAAATATLIFVSLTGVLPSLTGGYPAQMAVGSSGQYYDLYYVSDAEVAATAWLGEESEGRPVQSEVVSDKVAVTRMQAQLGNRAVVSDEFFPTLLRSGTYVYLGAPQVRRGVATVFWTGDLISYRYPTRVLDEKLDLVYSSTSASVYR